MGKYYLLYFKSSEKGMNAMYTLSQYPNIYSFSEYKPILKKNNMWIIYSDVNNINNINAPSGVRIKDTSINNRLKIPSFISFDKNTYEKLLRTIFNL